MLAFDFPSEGYGTFEGCTTISSAYELPSVKQKDEEMDMYV